MKSVLGIIAGLIVIIGTIPYLRDIIRRETKPSRATWLLLTLLMVLDIFVQGELGSGWARALTAGEFIATGSIFILALKYGVGGLDKLDKVCYSLWIIMVLCWLALDRPLLALHFGIFADLVGMVPTLTKSWKNPEEESINVFAASSLSGFIAIFAVTKFTYQAALLPIYLFLVNLATVFVILFARRKK